MISLLNSENISHDSRERVRMIIDITGDISYCCSRSLCNIVWNVGVGRYRAQFLDLEHAHITGVDFVI